jgi:hypothetical protein
MLPAPVRRYLAGDGRVVAAIEAAPDINCDGAKDFVVQFIFALDDLDI